MTTNGNEKDVNDLMFGNSAPWWDFNSQEDVRGRITDVSRSQKREFDPKTRSQGELLFWQPNNKPGTTETDRPVFDPVLTLLTPFSKWEGVQKPGDAGDDDSTRRVFVTSRSKRNPGSVKDALVKACVKAKSKIHVGDFVEIKRVGGKGNLNSPYLYEAEYWTAAAPPAWAVDLATETVSESDEDALFD